MVFLLHLKAYAYTNRTTRHEKAEDAEDIKFILTCLIRKHQRASREQRAWAMPDRFWSKFACDYPDQEANLYAVGLLRGQAPSSGVVSTTSQVLKGKDVDEAFHFSAEASATQEYEDFAASILGP
ncbi:hypothetical protein EPUS_08880 [Endocarpon pusillum Z07020]|uniref:Uncharacterized protein n=1 Tax=Endocarpon pusillum (strain Z07020 / HMAS-L-300199) TaxID=1263415 RepID=U1GQB9_ENDPU|nr:uncharacterized protein EPUS_08880 [Endocarpon pusillum Z07020]ERF74141.1 hypothetical protein EPUS_08880 [Endocarpon pusillum Z07020]